MAGQAAAMHVARIRSGYTDKQGRSRQYESRLLRRTYRDGSKVKHETLANLSGLPEAVVDSIEAALKGTALLPAGDAVTITRSLPHGHVAAVHAMAAKLGLPRLLGPACPQRDLALALIVSRVARPGSKLSTLTWWSDVTLGTDLAVDGAATDEVYAAMDWLAARQETIEAGLARRHLAPAASPQRMALFDLSSSWLEGTCCPLGERGHSRDGKKGKVQIEYGLLTDPEGRPVAVRVFEGNTADPAAFTEITEVVRDKFGLARMVMAGDRGMITTARIKALGQDQIGAEAALDGIYVIRTPVPAGQLDAAGVVTAYKNLKYVERDFRHIKADDLDLRPVFHRRERRVKGHVLICMLAAYLVWHLRQAWAPLTYTDEEPPVPASPVAPARRSASAEAKASRQRDADGRSYLSFRGLLAHLGTLTRNELRFAGTPAAVP